MTFVVPSNSWNVKEQIVGIMKSIFANDSTAEKAIIACSGQKETVKGTTC